MTPEPGSSPTPAPIQSPGPFAPRWRFRRPAGDLLPLLLLTAMTGCAGRPLPEAPPCLPLFLRPAPAWQAGFDAVRLARLDTLMDRAIAEGTIPGGVLLVARGGRVVHHRAYGARAVVPAREPMTLDTIFDLASLTKPVATAAAVMRLVEMGRLRLSDPVRVYLPLFGSAGKEQIRVVQLLTHTSGLAPYAPVDSLRNRFGDPAPEGVWTWICEQPPLDEPGSRFRYSDLNYITLARLVGEVSGRPLERFTAEEFYGPLGMKDTLFDPPPELLPRIAPTEVIGGTPLRGVVHDPLVRLHGGAGGSAGLFSTAWDVAVFGQMLLNGGAYGSVRIFSPLTIAVMTRSQEQGRGFGWDIASPYASLRGDLLGPASFGHTGYTGTSLWIDPDHDLLIVLMTNRVHPRDSGSVVALRALVSNVVAAALVIGPRIHLEGPTRKPQPTG